MNHLSKWAKREGLTCFRVYDRDLPNYPLVVEWLDGDCVAWLYDRKKDDTPEKKNIYKNALTSLLKDTFNLTDSTLFIKERRPQKGISSQYKKVSAPKKTKIVSEYSLKFELNLSNYLDIGLFLDHRKTRQLCQRLAKGKRVLNLFAYTGSFSSYALTGGACAVTTVDMNTTYINWAKRNSQLNGFPESKTNRFISENCFSFLKNDASKNRYDLIICDPPTFSNSKTMKKAFSINSDYPELLRDCTTLLAPNGILIFSTNSKTFSLDPSLLKSTIHCTDITAKTCSEDFKNSQGHRCWKLQNTATA